ncbi:MAG: hypothetical protein MUF58_01295 [Arcicella sp.]|jgi:hypothetical protein|nr:hypothetical protein [Arcicella sp.]
MNYKKISLVFFFVIIALRVEAQQDSTANKSVVAACANPGCQHEVVFNLRSGLVNYQFHDGVATLRTGEMIEGRFKFNNFAETVIFESTMQAKSRKIDFKEILQMSLTNENDGSTVEFYAINDEFVRQIVGGKVQVFEKSYVVNERNLQAEHTKLIAFDGTNYTTIFTNKQLEDWIRKQIVIGKINNSILSISYQARGELLEELKKNIY